MKTIVLVYELQTNDHVWMENFYPVFRFRQEVEKQGFSFIPLLEQELNPWFESQKEKEYFSLFLKETFFFLRGRISKNTFLLLKKHNAFFTNSMESTIIANDKLKTAEFCKENNIPYPKTFCLTDYKRIEPPVIIKPRFGSRGRNIELLKTEQKIENFLLKNKNNSENWIIQQFIDGERGTDLRILLCNQKIIGCFERKSDNLCSNSCQGATCKKTEVSKKLKNLALKICRGTDLFF